MVAGYQGGIDTAEDELGAAGAAERKRKHGFVDDALGEEAVDDRGVAFGVLRTETEETGAAAEILFEIGGGSGDAEGVVDSFVGVVEADGGVGESTTGEAAAVADDEGVSFLTEGELEEGVGGHAGGVLAAEEAHGVLPLGIRVAVDEFLTDGVADGVSAALDAFVGGKGPAELAAGIVNHVADGYESVAITNTEGAGVCEFMIGLQRDVDRTFFFEGCVERGVALNIRLLTEGVKRATILQIEMTSLRLCKTCKNLNDDIFERVHFVKNKLKSYR